MTPPSSPTIKRRRLAAELRRLRQASKLTIDQVAEALEWSPGKVSKIENARVSVLPRDARRLLDLYGLQDGPERDLMLALSREGRERGWWAQYGEAVPEWFVTYVGLESEAARISAYQSEYVPGLLQTHDYAVAVSRAALMNVPDGEIEKQVAVRMERQARLDGDDAPQLWVVLNEAVIRRVVGSRSIMQEQLVKLVDASQQANISLQVLPFSAGAHPAMDSAFRILSFATPTDSDIVYLEHPTCSLYLEKPDEVARYVLSFDHLRAVSLSFEESRRLLSRSAEDLA